jgi:HTH-type transcriptional regulator / antitoxin HipB
LLVLGKEVKKSEKSIHIRKQSLSLNMKNKKIKTYTLDEVKNRFIGEVGTPKRDQFEYKLQMELIGDMIKTARKERNLTQEELGKLVGVQKAQISKLENSANNVTIDTVVKVFKAMQAEVSFIVKLDNTTLKLA